MLQSLSMIIISPPGNTSAVSQNFAFLRFLAYHNVKARGISSQSLKRFLLKTKEVLTKIPSLQVKSLVPTWIQLPVSWVTSPVFFYFSTFTANASVVCPLTVTALALRILIKTFLETRFSYITYDDRIPIQFSMNFPSQSGCKCHMSTCLSCIFAYFSIPCMQWP